MNYAPLNYDQINAVAGNYHPSQVKAYNNKSFAFWERALFQRALSIMDFKIPWDGTVKDFFRFCLFSRGYVAVFQTPEYGLTFQPCGLSGYDWYYRPTNALVANPAMPRSLDLRIGQDCEILKLTPDYYGIWDIIEYYACKLSELDNAIDISLINNKYPFLLAAKNKGAAEALKKMLDRANNGEPAVIYDLRVTASGDDKSAEPWHVWDRGNLRESYLTTEQLADFRTLMHNFDTEIGIPTLPIEKKERMISSETASLEVDATSRSRVWEETFNESAKRVNDLFGTQISVELTYKMEGGVTDGKDNATGPMEL